MASAAPTENRSLTVVEEQPKRGRPSLYTPELADEICLRIANGETLTEICLDDDMPARQTVTEWLMFDREGFSGQYRRARAIQAIHEDDECKVIADNAYEDYYIDWKKGEDGQMVPFVVVNNESVNRARLRIATRQWRAERLNRSVYSPSVKVQHEDAPPKPIEAGGLPDSLSFLAGGGEGAES